MKKLLTTQQAGLIIILFTVALKLSVLPAMMYDYSGSNSYITCLIALGFDLIFTIVILVIMKKMPNITFFELITKTLSKPVAIIIYIFLYLYFFVKALITFLELHDYFIASLFEELNPIFFLITLIPLLMYLFRRDFRNLGRVLQICFWPVALGLTFTLIYPVQDMELTNLLPLFQDGFYPIYRGLSHTTFAFGDHIILLMLMGHIKYEKNTTKKLLFYTTTALGFVFNFFVVFVGSFGETAVNQTLALGELPLHNPYPATIGRLEWLTIIIWTAILLIQGALLGNCCTKCFRYIFGFNDNKVPSIITSIFIIVALTTTYLQLENVLKLVTSIPFITISGIFHTLLVILLVIGYFIQKRKSNTSFKTSKSPTNKTSQEVKNQC